jgi:hypothetical protein
METNYIKLNLPNIITIVLITYGMTFLVGTGARLMKASKGAANG